MAHVYQDQAYVNEMGRPVCAGCEGLYPRASDEEGSGWAGLTPTRVRHTMRCSLCGVMIRPDRPSASDWDADG